MNSKFNKRFWETQFFKALIGFASIALFWQFIPIIFKIQPTIFPKFTNVLGAVVENFGLINKHIIETLEETVIAFLIALGFASFLAILMEESKWFERIFLYPTIAFQNIPKVALAPLLVIWFSHGLGPKIAMGTLIGFFPIFENFRNGLKVNNTHLRSTLNIVGSKNCWLLLWKIKLPEAIPNIVVGLKIGITYSIIGVIVGELAQPSSGLGFLIAQANEDFKTDLQFGSVLVVSILGLILYGLVCIITNLPLFTRYQKSNTQ